MRIKIRGVYDEAKSERKRLYRNSVLFLAGYGESGHAFADIISGTVTPVGRIACAFQ